MLRAELAKLGTLPLRGEIVNSVPAGTVAMICAGGGQLDARRVQIIGPLRRGTYSVQLVDDDTVPDSVHSYLLTVGLRADDLYILPTNYGEDPFRTSSYGQAHAAHNQVGGTTSYMARAIFDTGAYSVTEPGAEHLTKVGGFCPILGVFDKLTEAPPFRCVVADGNDSLLRFWGTITLNSNTGSTRKVKIRRVYYAPLFLRTLLSGDGLDDEGYYCETGGGGLRIRYGKDNSQESILLLPRVPELEGGEIGDVSVMHMPRRGPVAFDQHPLGRGDGYPIPDSCFSWYKHRECPVLEQLNTHYEHKGEASLARSYTDLDVLTTKHLQLGHVNDIALSHMLRWDGDERFGDDENLIRSLRSRWCTGCGCGKSHTITETGHKHVEYEVTGPVKRVSADLKVDLPEGVSGFRHYLLIAVEMEHNVKIFTYLLRSRSAEEYMVWWLRMAHTQLSPHKIAYLYTDSGELRTDRVKAECKVNGTRLLPNLRAQHRQNPLAESSIKRVEESTRSASVTANMPVSWWPFAHIACVNALGKIPQMNDLRKSKKNKDGTKAKRPITPDEEWYRKTYDSYEVQMLDVFPPGCLAIAHKNSDIQRSGTCPGYECIYLCPLAESIIMRGGSFVKDNTVEHQRGHLIFRIDTGTFESARVVRPHMSFFPMSEGWGLLAHLGWQRHRHPAPGMTTRSQVPALQLPPVGGSVSLSDAARAAGTQAIAAALSVHDTTDLTEEVPTIMEEPVPYVRSQAPEHLARPVLEEDILSLLVPESAPVTEPEQKTESIPDEHDPEPSDAFALDEGPATLIFDSSTALTLPLDVDDTLPDLEPTTRSPGDAVPTFALSALSRAAADGAIAAALSAAPAPTRSQTRSMTRLGGEASHIIGTAANSRVVDGLSGGIQSPSPPSIDDYLNLHPLCIPLTGEANLSILRSKAPAHRVSKYAGCKDSQALVGKVSAMEVDLDLPPMYHLPRNYPLLPLIEEGMEQELQGLCGIKFADVPQELPAGYKAIDLLWVAKAKGYSEGAKAGLLEKIKMRLTMCGNQERHALTRMDAYAPVANRATYLVIMATYVGQPGVRFRGMDVVQAYMASLMKRIVFIRHPNGYKFVINKDGQLTYRRLMPNEKRPNTVMRLLRALYGGMECGRLFFDTWVKHHVEVLGFRQCQMDLCVLLKFEKDDFVIIAFHVDDSQVVYKGEQMWKDYQIGLGKRFQFTVNNMEAMLGMRIAIDYQKNFIRIDQEQQARKMLSHFGMDNINMHTVKTPVPYGPAPTAADVPTKPDELAECRALFDMRAAVGYMGYLNCGSRPDFTVGLKPCSTFQEAYGKPHIRYAKHVMRYIATHVSLPLYLRGGYDMGIQIFTDASHASNVDNRKSLIGVVIKVRGNTVYWACLYTNIVAHSSTESELMALDKGATIGQFVKWLCEVVGNPLQGPIDIFVDNQSTIDITTNPVHQSRNLHIHARYFYVKDLVLASLYKIWHLESAEQLADILVSFKSLETFQRLLPLLMGCARVERAPTGKFKWNTSLLM